VPLFERRPTRSKCRTARPKRIVDQMHYEETTPVTGVTRLVRQPGRARNVLMERRALVIAIGVGVPLAVHETRRPITWCTGSGEGPLHSRRSKRSHRSQTLTGRRIRSVKTVSPDLWSWTMSISVQVGEDRVDGRSRRTMAAPLRGSITDSL